MLSLAGLADTLPGIQTAGNCDSACTLRASTLTIVHCVWRAIRAEENLVQKLGHPYRRT